MLKTVSTISGFVSPTFTGDVTLANGNLIIGTSGKGIDFSATPGTGTSELLNDYEEGTWTPVLRFGGATTGITYIAGYQNGLYTKIGSQVTLTGVIYLSSKGSATGTATLIGLPYATANIDGAQSAFALQMYDIDISVYPGANVDKSTTNAYFYQTAANGAVSLLTDANFKNSSYMQFSLTYRAS